MPTTISSQKTPHNTLDAATKEIRGKWGLFVALGVALLLLGGIALGNLLIATVASVYYIGAMMLIGGVVQIIHSFQVKEWGNFFVWVLSGAFYALAGMLAFSDPLLASSAFTLVLAISLIVAGVLRIWTGLTSRDKEGWGWLVAIGVVSLLVGLLIAARWPLNGAYLIGLVLAVELIFQGWSFIAVGLMLRSGRKSA